LEWRNGQTKPPASYAIEDPGEVRNLEICSIPSSLFQQYVERPQAPCAATVYTELPIEITYRRAMGRKEGGVCSLHSEQRSLDIDEITRENSPKHKLARKKEAMKTMLVSIPL
jgi:hypothetical protein